VREDKEREERGREEREREGGSGRVGADTRICERVRERRTSKEKKCKSKKEQCAFNKGKGGSHVLRNKRLTLILTLTPTLTRAGRIRGGIWRSRGAVPRPLRLQLRPQGRRACFRTHVEALNPKAYWHASGFESACHQ